MASSHDWAEDKEINPHRKNVKEWCVEITQVVRKYVEGVTQKDAEDAALEDTWSDGVVEQRITHSEKIRG